MANHNARPVMSFTSRPNFNEALAMVDAIFLAFLGDLAAVALWAKNHARAWIFFRLPYEALALLLVVSIWSATSLSAWGSPLKPQETIAVRQGGLQGPLEASPISNESIGEEPAFVSELEASRELAPDRRLADPIPFYNLLSSPEEPIGGSLIRVKTSSGDIGLMVYGRIAIDVVTSNGRLLAPYGYIFLGPRFEESQWTNTISARQSTLGFLFNGPELEGFKTLARFETYFLSSVVDANVYGLAQYFLYAKLQNDDWAYTGGVTTALVNPLAPSVLNPAAGSNFGNLGFMRPQLRAERFLQINDSVQITPQFALSSPVGTDFFQQLNVTDDGVLLGEENGWPNIETRMGIALGQKQDGARYAPVECGFSGAIGELRFTRSDFQSPVERFTTIVWMYGADLRWQITPKMAIMAEGYYGNALGSYAAGNKQTFNLETGRGILASGGFLEMQFKPKDKWLFHAGFMIDDPLDQDVPLSGRVRQQNAYTNLMYVRNRYFQIGLELAHLWSGFKNPINGDNEAWVVHNKMVFSF